MDLKTALAETIAAAAGLPAGEVLEMIETPPDPKMGDAALPCFKLAKELRKAPPVIAQELAEKIEAELSAQGVEVIVDDRDERPGVKFKDADLIGIPVRITVGKKAAEGIVEYRLRSGGDTEEKSAEQAAADAAELVKAALTAHLA